MKCWTRVLLTSALSLVTWSSIVLTETIMKVLLLTVVLAVGAFALPQQNIHIKRRVFQDDPCAPTPDPNLIPPGNLNYSLPPLSEMHEGSMHGGLLMEGHSGLVTEVDINIITLTARFVVDSPMLNVEGVWGPVNGYIDMRPLTQDCFPSGNFSGAADGLVSVQSRSVHVEGSATLFINLIGNKVSIRILNINVLSFEQLCVDLGPDFIIGGSPVDWADHCANVKQRFDAQFTGATKTQVVERIRVGANNLVGQYTLEELIDLIGGGDGEDPDCTTARNH